MLTRNAAQLSRYAACLSLQTLGAGLILWQGLPIYRAFLSAQLPPTSRDSVYPWAVAAIVLIQTGYWPAVRLSVPFQGVARPVLGHIVQFVGRLALAFVSGFFAIIYYAGRATVDLTIDRQIVTVLVLFSMFCYSKELNRVGAAFNGPLP